MINKTNCPTGESGATNLSPIGDSFLYTETSQKTSGRDKNFNPFKRTVTIQISNTTFCYNRFYKFN